MMPFPPTVPLDLCPICLDPAARCTASRRTQLTALDAWIDRMDEDELPPDLSLDRVMCSANWRMPCEVWNWSPPPAATAEWLPGGPRLTWK